VQDPDNIAPAVVWLGSSESREVTGCVFELEGGRIMIDQAERRPESTSAPAEPAEAGAAVKLLARRTPPEECTA
jgi:hypothetical protein